jgi:two-component system OmpR family response regulator
MRVLFVEDDQKIALFVKTGLEEAGFAIDHISDGETGLHKALTETYDAAIIDLMLPELDGFSLIKRLRAEKNNTPILILSARRSVNDRVEGLKMGSDDYLVKPFAFSELLARLHALVRRASQMVNPASYTVADLTLDIHTRKIFRGAVQVELQPLEFQVLEYLMRHVGQVVSKTMIMENVWDYNFNPQTNVVEARICYLREKIDRDFEPKLIHTVRGVGYVFEDRS